MTTALSHAGAAALRIRRGGDNVWWVWFGDSDATADSLDATPTSRPSAVLGSVDVDFHPVTLAKVELDTCGAWLTLANAEAARPVVVRRAGWVDVRGHPRGDWPLADDRVGLGPGDSLALIRPNQKTVDTTSDDGLLDCLLSAPPDVEAILAAALDACGDRATPVAVFGVPHDLGADPRARVADAIGVGLDELALPAYPLGDVQPELWAEPPLPPRLARIRLSAGHQSAGEVRHLLDRLIASWRLTERVDEDGLKLAASELASNAVRHGGAAESATVRYLGGVVRIDVDDRSLIAPLPRDAGDGEAGGHGLHVVEAVADSWGVETRPTGKRVWCEVAVAPAR